MGEGVSLEDMGDGDCFDAPQQLVLVSGLPGRIAEQHLVEDDAH